MAYVLDLAREAGVAPKRPTSALTSSRSDADLLAAFVKDVDESAFSALVEKYTEVVYSTCERVLGDRHLAEDATQAVFLVLVKRAAALNPSLGLGGWLFRVAQLTAFDMRRKLKRADVREKTMRYSTRDNSTQDNEWSDIKPEIDALIAKLPERYREPLVLRYVFGLPLQEVATRLSCGVPTAQTRISRGLQKLRDDLPRAIPLASLGALLSTGLASPAPTGLAKNVAAVCAGKAAVSATARASASVIVKQMAWSQTKTALWIFGFAVLSAAVVHSVANLPYSESTSAHLTAPTPARQKTVIHFDFEDGKLPKVVDAGEVVPATKSNPSAHCLKGVAYQTVGVRLQDFNDAVFSYEAGMLLSFEYWMDGAEQLNIWAYAKRADDPEKRGFALSLINVTQRQWQQMQVPLSSLRMTADPGKTFDAGDAVKSFRINAGIKGTLYIDNLSLVVPAK